METTYFFVKPSEFTRYGRIDIDGKVEEVKCNDFNVPNEKENVMIFEAHYVRYDGKELTSDLRFIKNTLGQWKMSIPISRPAEEAPAVDEEKAPADSVAD